MNISPISINSFKGLNSRKPQAARPANYAAGSVSFGKKYEYPAYNRHKPDKSVNTCCIEDLKRDELKLVDKIDNRTNLVMKEINAVGDEAEKLRDEFGTGLYARLKRNNKSGKVTPETEKYHFDGSSCIECVEKDGEYTKTKRGIYDGQKLHSVVVLTELGDTTDEETFFFNKDGKLKKYTIRADIYSKTGGTREFILNEDGIGFGIFGNEFLHNVDGEDRACDAYEYKFWTKKNPKRHELLREYPEQKGRISYNNSQPASVNHSGVEDRNIEYVLDKYYSRATDTSEATATFAEFREHDRTKHFTIMVRHPSYQ